MSATMKRTAKRLAAKGRRGDKKLLHITDKELLALQATGRVTRNPKTGLPEAAGLDEYSPWTLESWQGVANSPDFDPETGMGISSSQREQAAQIVKLMQESGDQYSFQRYGLDAPVSRSPNTLGDQFKEFVTHPAFLTLAGGVYGVAGGGAGAAGAGAESGSGAGAGAAGEGTALYSTPASTGVNASGGAYSTAATTTYAGPGGTALGGSTVPVAALSGGGGGAGVETSGFDETGFFEEGGASPVDEAGFSFDPMSLDAPSSSASFENTLSGELAAGAPAEPSYYQQFLDYLKKRGMKSNLTTGLNLYSGISGLRQAREMEKLGRQADPMGPYRAGYAAELAALRADPSRLQSQPGYQAGEQAITRSMAAQGYLGSGNMKVSLANYGSKAYDQEIARLAALATAPGANPAYKQAADQQRSRSLASLGFAAMGLF